MSLEQGNKKSMVYDGHAGVLPPHKKILYAGIKNKTILDVGCGTGQAGRYLVENNNIVFGITVSEREAELAQGCMKAVYIGDLDELRQLPFENLKFDVIMFGDVLEHLKNPQLLLELSCARLVEDGIVIVSLPNIANIKIRLSLMFGDFDYMDSGILDRTHIKFFTIKTARQLIEDSGLNVIEEIYSHWNWSIFPRRTQSIKIVHKSEELIKSLLTKLFPGLLSTQVMFKARL